MREKPGGKTRSPWMSVGIGCGVLATLGLGGCVALAVLVKTAIDTPIDPVKNLAALQAMKIPVYPGATLNPALSKANGKALSAMTTLTGGKAKVTAAALDAPASVLVVRRWYGAKLPALGFKEESSQENAAALGRVDQVQWGRGEEKLLVQYMAQPEAGKSGSVVTLARITGLPKDFQN